MFSLIVFLAFTAIYIGHIYEMTGQPITWAEHISYAGVILLLIFLHKKSQEADATNQFFDRLQVKDFNRTHRIYRPDGSITIADVQPTEDGKLEVTDYIEYKN